MSESKTSIKNLFIFLGITFTLTWGLIFLVTLSNPLNSTNIKLSFAIYMLIPAISSLITRLITKEGFKILMLKPNLKGNLKSYLIAWFLPSLLIIFGTALYFIIFPTNFDPTMSTMVEEFKSQMITLGQSSTLTDAQIKQSLLMQIGFAILLAPVLNIITTLGEEIGWRAYLLPKLCERYSIVKSVLISGVTWGLWHAPMIALGHNYGVGYFLYPFGGIFAMIIFCVFISPIFSYVTVKTNSILPAAIAHGALNGFVQASFLFANSSVNPFIGPAAATGIIGGAGFIIAGFIFFKLLAKFDVNTSNNNNLNI